MPFKCIVDNYENFLERVGNTVSEWKYANAVGDNRSSNTSAGAFDSPVRVGILSFFIVGVVYLYVVYSSIEQSILTIKQ